MDYSLSRIHGLRNRCPSNFITKFASVDIPNKSLWVSFRFNPNKGYEHYAAIGNELGEISFLNVNNLYETESQQKFGWVNSQSNQICTSITLKQNAVMDLCFVPQRPSCLATISGCSEVRVFDLNGQRKPILFKGHIQSVKAISFFPTEPETFVTGGRDGNIFVWDIRDSKWLRDSGSIQDGGEIIRKEQGLILHGHGIDFLKHRQRRIAKMSTANYEIVSITSLAHINEYNVASSSAKFDTGIRIWDIRYRKEDKPVRILTIPSGSANKQIGISSLAVDRYASQLFAMCTDNRIMVYEAQSNLNKPVNILKTPQNNSFQVQCVTSPISDHLLCGSTSDVAYIFDLQENNTSLQDNWNVYEKVRKMLPMPKFRLNGHKQVVGVVNWSSDGRYIGTLGDDHLRIWDSQIDPDRKAWYLQDVPIPFDRPEILTYAHEECILEKSNFKNPTNYLAFLSDRPLKNKIAPNRMKTLSVALLYRSSKIQTSPTKKFKSPLKKRLKLEDSSDTISQPGSSRKNLTHLFLSLDKSQENRENVPHLNAITSTSAVSKTGNASSKKSKTTMQRLNKRALSRESTPSKKDQENTNRTILDYFSPQPK